MSEEPIKQAYQTTIEEGGYAGEVNKAVLENIPRPNRPMAPFMWFGGKGNLARWIIKHLPREGVRTYVEPYAGAASILWHLPEPYPIEVLNDLDRRIVNIFRVLQDREQFEELAHRLVWTPYSFDEFKKALEILQAWDEHDPVERAWAFFVAQNQGFGGKAESPGNWGRVITRTSRGIAGLTNAWRGRLKVLEWWHDRITRVQIDSRDALEVLRYWDTPETLFYVDPPYVLETRKTKRAYEHEQPLEHHEKLVKVLLEVKGKVALSGYSHEVYKPLEDAGWVRIEKKTSANSAGRTRSSSLRGKGNAEKRVARVEVLWLNYDPEVK